MTAQPPSDEERFDMMAGYLKAVSETLITEHFGERCPDFDPDCECCRRWNLMDQLIENPYKQSHQNGDDA